MADVNKSEAIRSFIAANPNAKPKEVVAALKEKKIEVSAAFVSTLKSNDKRTGKGKGPKAKAGRKPAGRKASSSAPTMADRDLLLSVKKFINENGGAEAVRSALDTVEALAD